MNSFEAKVTLHKKLLFGDSNATNGCMDSADFDASYHGVFIRAPAVVSVNSPKVEILATIDLPEREEPVIVGVSQDNLMITAFHPELTDDTRWHEYFLKQVIEKSNFGK